MNIFNAILNFMREWHKDQAMYDRAILSELRQLNKQLTIVVEVLSPTVTGIALKLGPAELEQ
jgi:hypothetical protein